MKSEGIIDTTDKEYALKLQRALILDEDTPALEKVLVIDPAKVKRNNLMIRFYKNYNTRIELGIILFLIGVVITMVLNLLGVININMFSETYLSTKISDIFQIHMVNEITLITKILSTVLIIPILAIIVFGISRFYVKDATLKAKIDTIKNKDDIYNKDFEIFINVLNSMDTRFNNYYYGFFDKKYNLSARLFNLVNIYAMDSFLEAGRQNDSEALKRITVPFMAKILEDILDDFNKKQEFDKNVKNREQERLNAQIELDIAVFNKNK